MTPPPPLSPPLQTEHGVSSRARLMKRVMVTLVSTLVVTGIAVVLLLANSESVIRWVYLNKLTSEDAAEYALGVNYVVTHVRAEGDEADRTATLNGVRARLDGADDAEFDAIVNALAMAGVWNRQFDTTGWMRYLSREIEGAETERRASIAAEFAALLWSKPRSKTSPRNQNHSFAFEAVVRLANDEDAGVRLNALSAVANLGEAERILLLEKLMGDEDEAVAKRARMMRELLPFPPPPTTPTTSEVKFEIEEEFRELARLEAMAVGRATGIVIGDDMPLLLRIYAVRASADSTVEDLLVVFDSEGPALRDLAVVVALERFDDAGCAKLAKTLIGGYEDSRRMAGAMLGGMCGAEDLALETLMREKLDVRVDWIVRQHFNLGLMMRGGGGETVEDFDPAMLLAHEQFPPTTLVMGLNWMGRKEGLDWLLNPLGHAPVDLELLFDQLRFWPVLKRALGGGAEGLGFSMWADRAVQRDEVERLREWYLMRRNALEFDREQKNFRLMK